MRNLQRVHVLIYYAPDLVCMSVIFVSRLHRSFVPPVRDEESETQRKAHAKRVRETRRSTQGVTLEDLKSAEQLVKKKQQQENQVGSSFIGVHCSRVACDA